MSFCMHFDGTWTTQQIFEAHGRWSQQRGLTNEASLTSPSSKLSPRYGHRRHEAEDCIKFAWRTLSSQNQKIVKNGKPLDTAQENLAELTEQAKTFSLKVLPILKAHQIA